MTVVGPRCNDGTVSTSSSTGASGPAPLAKHKRCAPPPLRAAERMLRRCGTARRWGQDLWLWGCWGVGTGKSPPIHLLQASAGSLQPTAAQ